MCECVYVWEFVFVSVVCMSASLCVLECNRRLKLIIMDIIIIILARIIRSVVVRH